MGVKIYKPVTNGRRRSSVDTFEDVVANNPVKSLRIRKFKTGGRNNTGKITVRHIGGGAKQFIRQIDYKRNKFGVPGVVVTIEYDPIRTARIALVQYSDGEKRYIIAPQDLKAGDAVISSNTERVKIAPGNSMPMEFIPVGSFIYNIELHPGKGGQVSRSAGINAQLMAVEGRHATVRMPSSEMRRFLKECLATIGSVSNPDQMNIRYGKAGRMRHLGIRPRVRGKAMNPVDHPHGGGEGHNPIGMKHPKTPWGKPALGVKTRRQHAPSNVLIIARRKKKQ